MQKIVNVWCPRAGITFSLISFISSFAIFVLFNSFEKTSNNQNLNKNLNKTKKN